MDNLGYTDVLLECVPNFSEGKNKMVLQSIANAVQSVPQVQLLHVDRGAAANRTVFTFAGPPKEVLEAVYRSIKTAAGLIDMRRHKGTHPRIGATDVCPLIPLKNISLEETSRLAHELGQKVGSDLNIPVFMYEDAARHPGRKNLASIRSGEYEGLEKKMQSKDWQPDYGNGFNPVTGATVIGARDILVAYNVNLNTESVEIANKIAREIRESGKLVKNDQGQINRIPGKCPSLKAIGWYIREYGKAQVSMNLTNRKVTDLHQAFEACKKEAEKWGVQVTGSELIGLVPLDSMMAAGKFFLEKEGALKMSEESNLIQSAIDNLGLNELTPFIPEQRIIEYLLKWPEKINWSI